MAKIVYCRGGKGEYPLCVGKPYFLIGRHPENDIVIDPKDRGVSRYHAAIFRQGEDYWIVSYGPHGTLYNPGEARFSSEHFIEDVRKGKMYPQLRARIEPEVNAALEAQMAEAAKKLEEQPVGQTMGPGISMNLDQTREINIIRKILGNSLTARMLSCDGKKLKSGGYIAMPAVNYVTEPRVFQVLF